MLEALRADGSSTVGTMLGASPWRSSPLLQRRLQSFAKVAAYSSIIVGSTVIFGWIVDSDVLKGAVGVPITMKANAALCFLLAGIALRSALEANVRLPYLRSVCAAIVAGIGGITLLEHVLGWNAGIDELLFREPPGEAATASPGRMGPPASFSFLCIGLGLLLIDRRTAQGYSPFRYLPIAAIAISLVPLVGYAYGSRELYARAEITGIAWPTAVTILVLSLGAIAARPASLLGRMVCAENAGGVAFRRLMVPALLIPFLVVFLYGQYRDAGFMDAPTGRATLAVTIILGLCTVVLITAYRLAVTAEKQAQAEAEVRRSARELEDFFDNAVIGLHWVNEQGIIVRANKADRGLLGYDEDEYVGRHIGEFHADADVIADILARLKRGELVRERPARLRCKDGSLKHVLIDSSVLWDEGRFVHTRCFTRDVTTQVAAELEGRRLSAIVESSNDAIIGKNLQGIVTSWNRAAERLFGYTADEMVGEPIMRLIPPDRSEEERDILSRIGQGQKLELFDAVRRRKDGELLVVSLSISPILDRDGQVVGASKIARDISERKRAEQEREALLTREREARTSAERAARSRDEFLALVSHELRTPLSGILGWAQYLKAQPLPETTAEGLSAIERGARAQARLIEDLLDMNRITTGRLTLDVSTVNLTDAVEAAVATIRPAASSKQIQLRTELQSVDRYVAGDLTRLQQVVWNLLSNAVKFTPQGGRIEVVLRCVESKVEISVKDTGIGLSSNFLPFVFDRFQQADSSTTRAYGGLGIGLSIAKHIVELHGGAMRAESAGLGCGATFIVQLPSSRKLVEEPAARATRPHPTNEIEVDLSGIRVLAIDDDLESVEMVRRVLSTANATVRTVTRAAEAIDVLASQEVDVVVSDIGLPQMDGYQLMRHVRDVMNIDGDRLPAVALTSYTRWEDRTKAMLAGYQMHLAKPVEPQELLATVASFMGRNV